MTLALVQAQLAELGAEDRARVEALAQLDLAKRFVDIALDKWHDAETEFHESSDRAHAAYEHLCHALAVLEGAAELAGVAAANG